MMSRWRETLCGSKIKTHQTEDSYTLISAASSEVLSNGGAFRPRPPSKAFIAKKQLPLIFLPTNHYEVLVDEEGRHLSRYGNEESQKLDDIEVIEGNMGYFDTKHGK